MDIGFAGIKVGMLGSRAVVPALGRILAGHPGIPRVVDPVLKASSGARLFERSGLSPLLRAVRGNASVLTPNMDEASVLAGMPVRTPEDMREAARVIFGMTAVPCLVKGGHLEKSALNILYDGSRTAVFGHEKLTRDVHGTGCFLSAAILAHLAEGRSLKRPAASPPTWFMRPSSGPSSPEKGAAFSGCAKSPLPPFCKRGMKNPEGDEESRETPLGKGGRSNAADERVESPGIDVAPARDTDDRVPP